MKDYLFQPTSYISSEVDIYGTKLSTEPIVGLRHSTKGFQLAP